MITIHQKNETNFTGNGDGPIDESIINPVVSWEMNGEFRFDFEYPFVSKFSKYIVNQNILRVPVPFMENQLFRIYRTRKTLDSIQVEARHIFYDLLDNLIDETRTVNQSGQPAIQNILNAAQYPHHFEGLSDITTTGNIELILCNPVEALLDDNKANSFISQLGGEILRDNFRIHMLRQMGSNRGVHIEHKKDLMGYEATIDESTVVTRIYPRGFGGLELPERYIDSPLLDPDHPKIKMVEYDVKAAVGESVDDEDAVPLEDAYELLRQYANQEFSEYHIDEPESTINVDFVTLNNTLEYKDLSGLQEIRQGDVVRISVPDEEYEITSRLIAFKSDPLQENHYEHTTLGNHVVEFTSSGESIDSIRKELEDVRNTATIAMQSANGKNRNFYGIDEPSHPSLGDLWYQNNGQETIMWQYVEVNGERFWREIANTADTELLKEEIAENNQKVVEAELAAADALSAGQQAQALAEQSAIDAGNALIASDIANNQINDAISNAGFTSLADLTADLRTLSNSAQQTAQTAITSAQKAISDAQEALSKADGLETITNNIQYAINDIEGSLALKADQQVVHSIDQIVHQHTLDILANAQGLQAKAEQSDVDLLNGTVNTLNTEVSIQAGLISQKVGMTEVQSTIDGLNYENRNLIIRNDELPGSYVANDGIWGELWTRRMIHYIPVQPGERITLTKNSGFQDNAWRISFYDSDKNYLNRYTHTSDRNTFTVPANVYYIRPSYPMDAQVKLERGSRATDWTPAPEDTDAQITTIQTEFTQRADGFDQSITQINTDLNGKVELSAFNTLSSTVSSTVSRIGTAEGRINSVESTANGTQQIVSGPNGLTTKVTTIADGFDVLARRSVQNLLTNPDFENGMSNWSMGSEVTLENTSGEGNVFRVVTANGQMNSNRRIWIADPNLTDRQGKSYTVKISFSCGTGQNNRITFGQMNGDFFEILTGNGANIVTRTFSYTATGSNTLSILFLDNGDYRIREVVITETGGATQAQLSVINDNINLRVARNDVVNQINISNESILIAGNKIHITGQTTINSAVIQTGHIANLSVSTGKIANAAITSAKIGTAAIGTAHIGDGVITNAKIANATIQGVKIQDASISSAKIINLDASRITGNTTNFVQSAWNSINSSVTLNANELNISAGNSIMRLTNGFLFTEAEYVEQISGNWVKRHSKLGQGFLHLNDEAYNRSIDLNGYQITFTHNIGSSQSQAIMRFNGQNIVLDNTSLGMNGNHINSVHWMQLANSNTHLQTHPNLGTGVLTDTTRITIGLGNRDNFQDIAEFTGLIRFNRNLLMQANNISNITRLSLQDTTTELLSNSSNNRGVLRSGQGLILGVRTGPEIHNTTRIIEVTGRIDFYRNLWTNGYTINGSSDERLKKHIVDTDQNSLSIIKNTWFTNFEWNHPDYVEGVQFGLIAQKTHESLVVYDDEKDSYGINMNRLTLTTAHALQQLDIKVVQLTNQIDDKIEDIIYKDSMRDIEIEKLWNKIEELEEKIV